MTRKEDDGELFSQTVLDWLTWIGAIAAALATIFGVFFPDLNQDAQRLAYGVAILLVAGSATGYYYQRRRVTRFKISEPLEPLASSAALRGLLPFEEADALPGRARDVQELYTLVVSGVFRFGVLWGESGCGKTSLLRAGFIPTLRENEFLPLYIPRPTKDPQQAIRIALEKEKAELAVRADKNLSQKDQIKKLITQKKRRLQKLKEKEASFGLDTDPHILTEIEDLEVEIEKLQAESEGSGSIQSRPADLKELLRAAAPRGKKVIIIFDQFEEFFLTLRTPRSRVSFTKWLGQVVADADLSVAFLVSIRADFFAQLQNLYPSIPEPTSPRTTYQLQNFNTEQARQILNEAARTDAIPFDWALINAVVSDLEDEGFIRPAELQIVGTRLKRQNIFNLSKYDVAGRARGILSSYINDEIKQSANERAARLILRLMIAEDGLSKSPVDLSLDDILHEIEGRQLGLETTPYSHSQEFQKILNEFVEARILIYSDDHKYNLVHDYLAAHVRTATEGIETNVERANRFLKRYIAEYKEDSKMRIPYKRIRFIQKYASAELKSSNNARELLKKSGRAFYMTASGVGALTIVLLVTIYGYLTSKYERDPINYVFGRRIVNQENTFEPLEGGDMIFGSETPDPGFVEQPRTIIPMEAFAIQQTEVTNRQYRICRQAGGCSSGPVLTNFYNNSEYDDHPVVYVTASQAREFCQWLGGDLPTSQQWERAARGLEGRLWPWGDDSPTPDRANIYTRETKSRGIMKAKDFSSGATPEGIRNLVGNVWEWTLTPAIHQDNSNSDLLKVWDGTNNDVRLFERGGGFGFAMKRITQAKTAVPENYDESLGFRCVKPGD